MRPAGGRPSTRPPGRLGKSPKKLRGRSLEGPQSLSGGAGLTDSEWMASAVAEYEAPLVRYAWRMTGDLERARDVVQDTFLRLCRADRAEVEAHLAQWLYTVCRNRALDVRRKEIRMQPAPAESIERPDGGHSAPSARLEHDESYGRALLLLAALPANQQECIRLKFQQGLSYKEIAGITQLTVSHVGVLIHNGLKTLRARLPETRRA